MLGIDVPSIYYSKFSTDKFIILQTFNRNKIITNAEMPPQSEIDLLNVEVLKYKYISCFILIFIFILKAAHFFSLGSSKIKYVLFHFLFWWTIPFLQLYFFIFNKNKFDFIIKHNPILRTEGRYKNYLQNIVEEMC